MSRNPGFGIRLEGSSNNTIYNNSLDLNRQNAFDDGINHWDDNRYSDFDDPGEGCIDRGAGLCISRYVLPGDGSADEHPRCRTPQEKNNG